MDGLFISREMYKGIQRAADQWVLSILFLMAEEIRNLEFSVERVEERIYDICDCLCSATIDT